MMLRAGLLKVTATLLACLVASGATSSAALAADPHEDPDAAEQVFDGVSLFRYLASSLDSVLKRELAELVVRLQAMPFASVPRSAKGPVDDFSAAGLDMAFLLANIDLDLSQLRELMGRHRLDEAARLGLRTYGKVLLAEEELNRLTRAVEAIGRALRVSSTPAGSHLRESYDDLMEKVSVGLREALDLVERAVTNILLGVVPPETTARILEERGVTIDSSMSAGRLYETLAELGIAIDLPLLTEVLAGVLHEQGITLDFRSSLRLLVAALEDVADTVDLSGVLAGESMALTDVTMKIEPRVAFVGDSILFEGVLTSEGHALAGREVDILLNGSPYVTIRTDINGRYQGTLQVPYWYIPTIDVRALYYPREEDIDRYISSQSPVIELGVLFYRARLEVEVEGKAYPGLGTIVTGEFDYDKSPSPEERSVEIYIDDVLASEFSSEEGFSQSIELTPELTVGTHTVTVSVAAADRYAPVVASAILNVTRAAPILDMNTPLVVMIPGTIRVEGRICSDIGPLMYASITTGFNESEVELTSAEDGTFGTRVRVGMGLGLMGSQELTVRVIPQEPWHSSLTARRNVIMINVVNCSGVLVLLALLGIFLRRRLRGRIRAVSAAPTRTGPVTPYWQPGESATPAVLSQTGDGDDGDPRSRTFRWYRLVVGLVQRVTGLLLGPKHTLREFARETSAALGPASKYFLALTAIVERLLYSRQTATEEDAEKSEQLSHGIEEGLAGGSDLPSEDQPRRSVGL